MIAAFQQIRSGFRGFRRVDFHTGRAYNNHTLRGTPLTLSENYNPVFQYFVWYTVQDSLSKKVH